MKLLQVVTTALALLHHGQIDAFTPFPSAPATDYPATMARSSDGHVSGLFPSVLNSSSAVEGAKVRFRCPFLDVYRPDASTGMWKFLNDCKDAGLKRTTAFIFAFLVAWAQKGIWAALRLKTPDLATLDEAPPISHDDVYWKYPEETEARIKAAMDSEGRITIETLVDIKKWIAQQAKVEKISAFSRSETSLLFIKAGGDLKTRYVDADNVLRLLRGDPPKTEPKEITMKRIMAANKLNNWE